MMMKPLLLAVLFVAAALDTSASAHAAELLDINECHAHRLPDARADCEKRRQAKERAFRKEQERKRREKNDAGKPSDGLCFKRSATEELVCPNL